MKLKDFTFKFSYKIGDRFFDDTISSSEIEKGYSCDSYSLLNESSDNSLKLTIKPGKSIELCLAEIIFDHYFENKEWFFANGYQSWTTSREYKKGDTQYGLRSICQIPAVSFIPGCFGDYHFTQYGKDLYHSFTYTYLRTIDRTDLIGSLNERTGYTIFYADMKQNIFVITKDVEGKTINSDYELFSLVNFTGSYDDCFDNYFNAYPLKNSGRVDHFSGYTSWYNYFQNINEEIINRDLDGILRAGSDANIFQIDDGYETYVGDWDLDTNKFPGGMRPIVDRIHAGNLKAGLWICPFGAQFKSNVAKNHPEWLIKDSKGKRVYAGIAWGGFWALDIELPEVKEYIKKYFDKVFDEWNFDMVKLDFLYAACIIPRNNKTRGQLMCEAMDFLREICRDKIILGCGVPLGPAFGIVDACRISCDVELSFKDKFYVKLTNQEIVSARNAMNNSIFRRHLNGRIFANDPDVFFLRDDGFKPAKYTMEQKKLLAKINHMFGSVLFVSDNVTKYDDEKMAILKEAYSKFDGKILSAEYVSEESIRIVYEEKGAKKTLTYNVYTGDSEIK